MRFLRWLLRYIAVFSGLGAGFAKLMEMPGEVLVYGHAGLAQEVLYLFGSVQVGAACLMLFARTRAAGGVVLAATFGVSSYLLFHDAETLFGVTTGAVALVAFVAAFWQRDLRGWGNGYVRPGSEIWR